MKFSKVLLVVIVAIALHSCKKQSMASMENLNENVDTTATLLAMGDFIKGPYGTVSGKGKIYKNPNGSFSVVLDSFTTTNGPDLYVYVSKQAMPIDFINAGKLKSTMGRQVYELTSIPDLSEYKYICITAENSITCLDSQ